jgi:serine/threonine protein kinase
MTFRSSLRSLRSRASKGSSRRSAKSFESQISVASTTFESNSDDNTSPLSHHHGSVEDLHESFLANLPRVHRVDLEVSIKGRVRMRRCLVDDDANVFMFVSKLRSTVFGKISQVCLLDCPNPGEAHEPTNKMFALKEYRKSLMARSCSRTGNHVAEDALSELILQQSMHHPNVMSIAHCFHDDAKIYAAFPFAEGGDLFEFAKSSRVTSEKKVARLIKSLLQGVQYCHTNGVAHHDISLENIVLQGETPLVVDFGAACQLTPDGKGDFYPVDMAVRQGKRAYKAPELYKSASYDARKVDLWALGVCMYMLLFQLEPWNEAVCSDEHFDTLVRQRRLAEALESWGFAASKNVVDVLEAIFEEDPSQRPTIPEVLAMPLFA